MNDIPEEILRAAAEWLGEFLEFQEGGSPPPAMYAKFRTWLCAHPDHAAAYLEIQRTVDDIRDLPGDELIRRDGDSHPTSDVFN